MRRLFGLGLVGLMGVAVSGCPIYDRSSDECYYDEDCLSGQYCNTYGYCQADGYYNTAGYDGPFHVDAGAAGGQQDGAVGGSNADASVPETGADAQPVAPREAGPDAAAVTYCGNPNDCAAKTCGADGVCHDEGCNTLGVGCVNQFLCAQGKSDLVCTAAAVGACSRDGQCVSGSKCVDGTCTVPAELCSDKTQCPTGDVCVDGKCVVACDIDTDCRGGFRCRTALHICNDPAHQCTTTSDCADKGFVCIDGSCVQRCNVVGSCNGWGTCVWNGCVPVQGVVRHCDIDGQASGCAAGQICVHHTCYTSCDASDGGACTTPDAPICKPVSSSSGSHYVCAPADSFGADCDPLVGPACAVGTLCIDGLCK